MRTKYFLLAGTLFTIFFACQKEPDGTILNPPVSTCKLEKAIYYNDTTSAQEDTAGYVYSGDQLTRINHIDYYVTLEYSNNKISKRNFIQTGTTAVVAYDKFTYNGDGTMSKAESYFQVPGLPLPIIYYSYDYSYTSGKLTSVLEKTDTSALGGSPLVPYYNDVFTYTGNNITRCISEYIDDHSKDTLNYSYDNVANYFAKNPALLFTDNLFLDFDPVSFPLVFSANNVTAVTVGSGGSTISYLPTDKGDLKEFSINGKKQSSYVYKCQ